MGIFHFFGPEARRKRRLEKLKRSLPGPLVDYCTEMSGDDKHLIILLSQLKEITRLVRAHYQPVVKAMQGGPHGVSVSLVGTCNHPVSGAETTAELRDIIESILGIAPSGLVRVVDAISVVVSREDSYGGMGTEKTFPDEGSSQREQGHMLLGFIVESGVTAQDLSYVGGGASGPIDIEEIVTSAVYGRLVDRD